MAAVRAHGHRQELDGAGPVIACCALVSQLWEPLYADVHLSAALFESLLVCMWVAWTTRPCLMVTSLLAVLHIPAAHQHEKQALTSSSSGYAA